MIIDWICLRLRDFANRRLGRYERTEVTCIACQELVSEWVTIRWQVTSVVHWPSTDGRALAHLCLGCAVPARMDIGTAIRYAILGALENRPGSDQ